MSERLEVRWMYEVPVRLSTESESDRRGGLRPDRRLGQQKWRVRPRERRSRRYLLYTGLVLGFCALLAFAGCGTIAGNGQLLLASGGVNFGNVAVGNSSTATVSFTNAGTGAISVSGVNVTGAPFAIAGTTKFPLAIAGGSTLSLQVQFSPSTAGQAAGTVTVMSNAGSAPPTISLAGMGVVSGGGGRPGALSSVSCTQSSMIGAGTASCYVALDGAAASGGLMVNLASNSAAVTVPGSVTIPATATGIAFTAQVAAVATAQSATLTANAAGISHSFALQLNAALRVLSANASQVSFGAVAINATATQSVVLTSSGTQAVTVNSALLTGSGFSLVPVVLPVTMNPGQSITVQLAFLPTIAGTASGQITVTSDATAAGTMAIPLSGTGSVPYAVELAWVAAVSPADAVVGYNVYRSLNGGSSFQRLNSAVNAGITFSDPTVQNGQSYVYYVTSVDGSGFESGPSNTFDATIP